MMQLRRAVWLVALVVGCGGETSQEPREQPRQDAGEPPPIRTETTAKECFAGITLTPGEPEPYMQIAGFVTEGGKYEIVRAREKRGSTRGFTTNYQLARFWIDGGDEQGTCVTDANAMTYSTTHHNFDDRYTVTTEHATYAFHESFDFGSENAAWNNTLEVRDAEGSLTEGPLTLLDVCRAEITPEQQGSEIVCNPAEPPLEPGADEDDWDGCPPANDFPPFREEGGLLAVAEGAVYCAAFRPEQTLQEAFATRAMLRFTPGEYALPTASTADYRMPVCARMRGVSDVLVTRPAQLMHSMEVVDWQDVHRYALDAPLEGSIGATLRAEIEIAVNNDAPAATSLAGHPNLPLKLGVGDADRHAFKICADGERCEASTVLDSCLAASDGTSIQHLITFESGDMLSVKLRHSSAPTERVSFTVAWGRWRGRDFQQRDPFKLIYAAPSDHSARSVAVLFDEPIDGACGLRVSDIDPLDPSAGTAATVDCDLEDIENIAIVSTELPSL